MTIATRIAVMHQGEVQQFADPDTVYRYPANLFVARFMGSPPMNTMPARLEAEDGGPVVVIGAGRPDEVRLRLQGYDAAASFVDRDVVLGIRPECIAEGSRGFSGASGAPIVINAPVEMVEPTGAETIVLLRLGGEPVLARVAFLDIDAAAGEALVREVAAASGSAPLFVACDLLDIDALRDAMAQVRITLGDAAVLVNNAANDQRQVLSEVTPEQFDWMIG